MRRLGGVDGVLSVLQWTRKGHKEESIASSSCMQ